MSSPVPAMTNVTAVRDSPGSSPHPEGDVAGRSPGSRLSGTSAFPGIAPSGLLDAPHRSQLRGQLRTGDRSRSVFPFHPRPERRGNLRQECRNNPALFGQSGDAASANMADMHAPGMRIADSPVIRGCSGALAMRKKCARRAETGCSATATAPIAQFAVRRTSHFRNRPAATRRDCGETATFLLNWLGNSRKKETRDARQSTAGAFGTF